jgi:hypothetical protein
VEIQLRPELIEVILQPNHSRIEGGMASLPGRIVRNTVGLAVALVMLGSCSGSGTEPIKDLTPFVGVWEAESLTLSSPDNPSQGIDLVEQGASYVLSILATGQYTAVFDLIAAQGFQAGTVKLFGNRITLTPSTPAGPSTSGTWLFQGETLLVTAETLVDYDQHGEDELVSVVFAFVPTSPESA